MWRGFLFLALPLTTACGADWRQQLSAPIPGPIPLPRPMHAAYHCGWTSFGAANLDVDYTRAGGILQLDAKGGTIGFVRTLWRIDATHTARAQAGSLRPIDLKQVENYSGKTLRTELHFDSAGVLRLRSSTEDKSPGKPKRYDFPNLFDLHSALLFVRSQKLRDNDVLNIVVYPATAPYLATLRVAGHEKVQVRAGRFPAIKLDLKLQSIDRNWQLEPHQKFKRATAWLSDDSDRLLLKVQAEIFVGSVWAELASVKFSGRP